MRSYQCRTAIEVMNQLDGVNLHEKRGGKFHFYMQLTKAMKETPIEALDLSPRSFNSLKRADYHTIGDVAHAIAAGKDLRTIRNCGAKSIREIMEHCFCTSMTRSLQAGRLLDRSSKEESRKMRSLTLNYWPWQNTLPGCFFKSRGEWLIV